MTIAKSRPFAEKSAVEVAILYVAFANHLSDVDLQALSRSMEEKFSVDLPGSEQSVGQTIPLAVVNGIAQQVAVDGTQQLHEVSRFLALNNGRFAKRLRGSGNVVSFECHVYKDFNEFKENIANYLIPILKTLNKEFQIAELGFIINNKFLYEDNLTKDNYSHKELFRVKSPRLTPASYNFSPLWHLFQGWFVELEEIDNLILNQLNISNSRLNSENSFFTTIEHRALYRINSQAIPLQKIIKHLESNDLLNKMHSESLNILKDLLTDKKLAEIGISHD